MLFACWSVKGGSGTTVVAASLALLFARSSPDGVLLVDAAGDLPAALGALADDHDRPGLAQWLTSEDPTPASLARLELEVAPGLGLVPWTGSGGASAADVQLDALIATLAQERRAVVVDCGSQGGPLTLAMAGAAGLSLLVLRPCYLALRRAMAAPIRPSGLVVVLEPGRCLTPEDMEDALGVPVRARVPWSDGVARAVDAGLLAGRLPRALTRSLEVAA
jgi:MinD-like ATPase involved in chromosome partitioning or flagellar assembly